MYKISIIGSGNLAWHLAPALEAEGHLIREISSRNLSHAQALTSRLYEATPINHLDFSSSDATVFIIAASDKSISEIAGTIQLPPNSFLCHTSGSIALEVLGHFDNAAVFYPLQTFSKSKKVSFEKLPICLEGSNERTRTLFHAIAKSLKAAVHVMDSDKRKALHLSAVFACNFTNHLLGIAGYILKSQDIPSAILQPLIAETIRKAMEQDPFSVQTGPAVRNDQLVMKDHLDMLEEIPVFQKIYKNISKSIKKQRKLTSE